MPRPFRAWAYGLAAVACLGLAVFLSPHSPQEASSAKTPGKPPALPPAALSGTVSAPAPEVIPPKPSETVAALQKMREKDPAFIARKRVLDSRVAQGDAVVGDRRPLPEHLCGHLHQWRGDR